MMWRCRMIHKHNALTKAGCRASDLPIIQCKEIRWLARSLPASRKNLRINWSVSILRVLIVICHYCNFFLKRTGILNDLPKRQISWVVKDLGDAAFTDVQCLSEFRLFCSIRIHCLLNLINIIRSDPVKKIFNTGLCPMRVQFSHSLLPFFASGKAAFTAVITCISDRKVVARSSSRLSVSRSFLVAWDVSTHT